MSTDDGFDVGTTLQFTAHLTSDGTAADAASVVFRIKAPDGTTQTSSVTHVATGSYSAQFTVDQPGEWYLRWESTNPTSAHEETFFVRYSAFS